MYWMARMEKVRWMPMVKALQLMIPLCPYPMTRQTRTAKVQTNHLPKNQNRIPSDLIMHFFEECITVNPSQPQISLSTFVFIYYPLADRNW